MREGIKGKVLSSVLVLKLGQIVETMDFPAAQTDTHPLASLPAFKHADGRRCVFLDKEPSDSSRDFLLPVSHGRCHQKINHVCSHG